MPSTIKPSPVLTPSKKRGVETILPTPPDTSKKPRRSQGRSINTNSKNSMSPCRDLGRKRRNTVRKAPDTKLNDNTDRVLFIHPDCPKICYTGEWAVTKLKGEIAKYKRVKSFWLFEDRDDYFPSYDDKEYFMADVFTRELQSTWVLAWLKELIGEEKVKKLEAAVEEKLHSTDKSAALDHYIMDQQ